MVVPARTEPKITLALFSTPPHFLPRTSKSTLVMTDPARSSRAASQPWPVLALDDAAYQTMAAATKQRIVWDRIVNDDTPGTESWKWRENVRNFSLYTKHVGGFRVLSTGVLKGSVHEVATLLVANSQHEFTQKTAALYDKAFKQGTYIADVAGSDRETETGPETQNYGQLSVRSVTFARPGWRRREEEWCFLEATQFNKSSHQFEKHLTTLAPHEVVAGSADRKLKRGETKRLRDAILAYRVSPAGAVGDATPKLQLQSSGGASVRVHFYAEQLTPPTRHPFGSFSMPSTKRESAADAVQSRLLQIAKDCDRLAQLVRRRRLGIQVLVDQRRVLPPINAHCLQCDKSLLVAKLCRICGHSVCSDCSDKYERETSVRSQFGTRLITKRLETIRVCDPCLVRVDRGEYSCMSDAALSKPAVVPDPLLKNGNVTSAAVDLKRLLQDALLETQSPTRKSAVLNVIRSLLDQEKSENDANSSSRSFESEGPLRKTTLVPDAQQLDADALAALDHFVLSNTPYTEAQLAGGDGRAYTLTRDYEATFTATENEAARLQALEDLQVLTSAPCDELDIICSLAAKEVGVFASIVSIVTDDAMRVVAASDPSFKAITSERAHSFCTHAIMDDKPLIIAHPEADVRVSYTKVATAIGARFYCGFPLVTDGDKVLGTLCCLDQQKHDLTESQFTAMQRLAQTAAKIIKVRGDQQRQTSRAVVSPNETTGSETVVSEQMPSAHS